MRLISSSKQQRRNFVHVAPPDDPRVGAAAFPERVLVGANLRRLNVCRLLRRDGRRPADEPEDRDEEYIAHLARFSHSTDTTKLLLAFTKNKVYQPQHLTRLTDRIWERVFHEGAPF